MFWARVHALKPLLTLALDWTDFPEEPVPIDGTVARIERLLPFVAQHAGYTLELHTFRNYQVAMVGYTHGTQIYALCRSKHVPTLILFEKLGQPFVPQARYHRSRDRSMFCRSKAPLSHLISTTIHGLPFKITPIARSGSSRRIMMLGFLTGLPIIFCSA